MSKEIKQDIHTDFYNKVIQDLSNIGMNGLSASEISFMVDSDSEDITVDYKCMSTGLHYQKREIDEKEVIEAGFNWWPTWNFYEK